MWFHGHILQSRRSKKQEARRSKKQEEDEAVMAGSDGACGLCTGYGICGCRGADIDVVWPRRSEFAALPGLHRRG